jgi:F-type H+-transporting ATPase subunit alpha
MVATLNQPQHQPWPMEEQVVAIFAGVQGLLDDIPAVDVPRFQDELREYLRTDGSIYEEIEKEKDLSDELQERIHEQIKAFKDSFAVHEDTGLVGAAT